MLLEAVQFLFDLLSYAESKLSLGAVPDRGGARTFPTGG